jgi:hypothetical protein
VCLVYTQVQPKKTGLTPQSYLRYFYYAGVACIGEYKCALIAPTLYQLELCDDMLTILYWTLHCCAVHSTAMYWLMLYAEYVRTLGGTLMLRARPHESTQ